MSDQACWPDDWAERLEAKLDAYREETRLALHGDPSDPSRPGIDGRLRTIEREWGLAKRGGLSVLTLGLPAAWAYLKSKFGNQ